MWKEGTTYHAAYADFNRGGAVVHATSENLVTGWVRDKVLGFNSQEGNIVLPIPGGGYRLYLEVGNGADGTPSTYRTCDFSQDFSTATPQVSVVSDVPMRNGKICAARGTQTFTTWQARLASVPPAQRSALADADQDGLSNLAEYSLGTDPLSPSAQIYRPQPYVRTILSQTYSGIRYPWLRQAGDLSMVAELLLPSGAWSAAQADITVESLTLLSDGTTRVEARSTQPLNAGNATTLLRTRASIPSLLPHSSERAIRSPKLRRGRLPAPRQT